MCWMTLRKDDAPLASGLMACREHEQHSGGHSWGYAISDGEKLEVFKQTGTIDQFKMSPEAEAAMVHTRFATRGEITEENAHPFRLTWEDDDGNNRAGALSHNGTWYGAPDDGRADSYHMARKLEEVLRNGNDLETAIKLTGMITGETFVVLTDDARSFVHSGRFEITMSDEVIASSGEAESIPDGEVREL